MTISSIFYYIILGPLVLLLDVIYSFTCNVTQNPGLSIIFLSLVINLLVLPLYRRADAIQAEEQRTAAALKPGVDHIKKVFKGDERFMMLQTYYRQNSYKPYYALKGSLSLLLEIPFFIAAYRFLSNLNVLQGTPFGPIRDLSAPDGLLNIAGHAVNLLPILMTAINIVSGAVYTRGHTLRSKLQLYGMALVFLVLLYDSPSGLVFYWTLNNVFSLAKNVITKLKHPKRVIIALCSLCGLGFLVVAYHRLVMPGIPLVLGAALQLPLVLALLWKHLPRFKALPSGRQDHVLFYLCCVLLVLQLGLLIPTAVIRSSPMEFVDIQDIRSPLRYVWVTALMAVGTFLVWFNVFFHLTNPSRRRLFATIILVVTGTAILDYMLFGRHYGTMSSLLQINGGVYPRTKTIFINLGFIAALAALLVVIRRFKPALVQAVALAGCLAMAFMTASNMVSIQRDYNDVTNMYDTDELHEKAQFALDKSGRNVIVIMMDRAVNGFVPFIMEEQPQLKEKLAGFTYYPNTMSYGPKTNTGVSCLFGGYEYTPERMDQRDDMRLVEKHNEALKVMPVMFLEHGSQVTVCDPTYAGYKWIPDLSVFDDYPEINRYITSGNFALEEFTNLEQADELRYRNFFCYSIMRSSPVALHNGVYDGGLYNQTNRIGDARQIVLSLDKAQGADQTFIDPYAVLCSLPHITKIQDKGKDTFLMLSNDTAHEPNLLQMPECVPAQHVDNEEYDAEHAVRRAADGSELRLTTIDQMIHYQSNMAALMKLGDWMDYLRENGVYDNTRVIIVADHGQQLGLFDMTFGKESCEDVAWYNPLLLVKDFNSREFTTDERFMTNADTPTLATAGIIDAPVNPFTGKPINSDPKLEPEQHVAYTMNWSTSTNNGNTFQDITWLAAPNDNIRNLDKWHVIGDSLD